MPFLPTSPPLDRALAERNYFEPTPVQTAVVGEDAVGRDLLVSAQTGSGKTLAYGLAIAKDLLGDSIRFDEGEAPLALIVAPTRELALQVHRELTWLYQHAGARVVSCVGGMDPRREQRELEAGAHIVVGTPGRLCDHLRRGRLDVSALKAVVLDEADEMLDLGFREDMEFILSSTPEERRTLLFSATLPRGIVALAKQFQNDAFRIAVTGGDGGHADIDYRVIRIAPADVEHAVVNVLRYFESPSTIVFCNTREAVRHLQASLLERGFSVVALSGELTQNERTQALQALRDGRARVCVATDVAARGLDLPNLDLVINTDLPNDPEVLQHRCGRTGRAGRKGTSVLLVTNQRRRRAEMLLNQAGIEAEWGPAPAADEIQKLDQERMLKDAMLTQENTEDDLAFARALLAERSAEDIAAALARLYRARLPSPEDLLDPGQSNNRSRDVRGERHERNPRSEDFDTGARSKKPRSRDGGMPGGSVWFRAAIGRRKNAEARWLLPMICRRGGINRNDIGAIRILDTTTEFEVSEQVAEQFAAKAGRPDKEDNIRIEPLAGAPTYEQSDKRPDPRPSRPPRDNNEPRRARSDDEPRFEKRPRQDKPFRDRKPSDENRPPRREAAQADSPRFNKEPGFKKKFRPDDRPRGEDRHQDKGRSREEPKHRGKPAFAGKPKNAGPSHGKPAFGKKPKRNDRG